MGYYTYFEIEADNLDLETEEFANVFQNIAEYSFEHIQYDHAKWYDFEPNMKELSLRYPDTLFTVTGIGEESDDRWKAYFKNGKTFHARAEIIYPEFDESKLK